jgi:hypothetical protein
MQHITAVILALAFLAGSFSGVQASTQAAPASAGANYYVSQSGSGTACSSSSPCSLSTGINKLAAGDTLIIQGTLTTAVVISKSGTSSSRININGGKIAAPHSVAEALLVSGSYINITNLEVTGGSSFGVRVKGHDVKLTGVSVHDSVWENRSGDACIGGTGGWGRGLTFAPSSYNVEVSGGSVYNNCGEGVGFTQNKQSYIHGTVVYDNFSRNIYIGNAAYVTVENVKTYYSNRNFYRNGEPGRCIGLAIETTNYSTVGNMMHNTVIRGNTLTDCKGINFYAEVSGQYPSNVMVENNTFVRVAAPQVDIPGSNITVRNNTVTNSSTNPTATPTTAPVQPTATSTTAPIQPTATPVTSGSNTQVTTDDKNSAFAYSSGWTNVSSGSAYGGSYHQTSINGSSTTYNFAGTDFTVVYKGGPSYRSMDVFIDGSKVGTINQQKTASTYDLHWDYPGTLSNAQHTLKLVFVASSSSNNGSVDAVVVTGSSGSTAPIQPTATPTSAPLQPTATPTSAPLQPTATATTVNPGSGEATYDDGGFNYSSGWTSVDSGSAYKGSYSQTSVDGASSTFVFTGTSLTVVYKGGPSYRLMNVLVDGALVGTIDQQRSESTYDLRWDLPGTLVYGQHTLQLVFVGSSSTNKGSVDAVIVR